MCYGLKGAVPTFCCLMRKIFNHIPSHRLALYMDDLRVISKTFSRHLENLQETFDTLRKHGLHIKAVRCYFAMSEVTFLGHKITNPCILKWKLCKNGHHLQTSGIYRYSLELWAGIEGL